MVDENNGWIAGDAGTILHTSTGGNLGISLHSAGEACSGQLMLHQNFPNPFHNQTSIRFEIPKNNKTSKEVSLQIYSLDGRLITTLYHGYLKNGSYVLHWDGKTLSGNNADAGVYMVKLDYGSLFKFLKITRIE